MNNISVVKMQGKNGGFALVDTQDFCRVNSYCWTLNDGGYPIRYVGRTPIYMHHEIIEVPKGFDVDHRNRCNFDCTRDNIRVATTSQNLFNSTKRVSTVGRLSSSDFKGVMWDSKNNRWEVRITANRKRIFVGRFDSEIEAAKAYDSAARKYHGTFARLNFPLPGEQPARLSC